MQATALTSTAVVDSLKTLLKWANKDFNKYPNATHWIVQTRAAFVYQQAFYFFNNASRTASEKQHLLALLEKEPTGNWGDVICQFVLGVSLKDALREFGNCP